jgi:hypothetical protein
MTSAAPDMFNGAAHSSRVAPTSHAGIGLPLFCNACNQSPCCCNCADTEKL